MLDVAIVGGGLCGLALAHSLQAAKGLNWQLFEARERLGGRAWTVKAEDGTPVDLGATWFWPHNQPSITRLVADLGLHSFLQPDDGRVLHLHDPNQPVHAVALTEQYQPAAEPGTPATPGAVHGGAMRVKGGVGAVIDAIAAPLPKARLNLDHRLISVVDRSDHVELTLQQGDTLFTVDARRVVLALPPRVLDATVRFTPELDGTLRTAMRDTPTWMATAAKTGFVYKRAFWQEAGLTGNAWVTHAQAMLAEVFDASGPDDGAYPGAALAGFAAMGASQRPAFERSRALLLESQAVQLFGESAADPSLQVTQLWKDWAQDDTTCSPLDVEEENMGGVGHPQYGLPVLAEGHWQGRLYLGGTETASRGGGYLEGALNAAGRLCKQLPAQGLRRLGGPRARPCAGAIPRTGAHRPVATGCRPVDPEGHHRRNGIAVRRGPEHPAADAAAHGPPTGGERPLSPHAPRADALQRPGRRAAGRGGDLQPRLVCVVQLPL